MQRVLLLLLALVMGALLAVASAQAPVAAPVAKKAAAKVRETANSKVDGVRADIKPCSDLSQVEPILPTCDLSDPKTRDSVECRTLLKGAGSKELGTAVEIGRIRGARYLLPATEAAGKRVKMGGAGHGSLFEATITPEDFNKPVGLTLRAFHGADVLGKRMNMTTKDFSFLGTPGNLAGNVVGVVTEQCDEAKVQPGSRVVCGVCAISYDNIKELTLEADSSNKEVVSLPLEDGDTELGAIVSAAPATRAGGAFVAAAAGAAALVAALAF